MAHTDWVVPESDIRKLYQFLRDYPKLSMHREIAETISKKPGKLGEMLVHSYAQCVKYNNATDSFHSRHLGGQIQFTEARLKSDRLANRVLVSLAELDPTAKFPFSYVDYEIRPFRVSRRQQTSDTASKEGQVDVLMRSSRGVPVIGEIKAKKDATLLLALIQSLALAVEFASPWQRARLQAVYPNSELASFKASPQVEVCLIRASPPEDDVSKRIFKAVDRISRGLMDSRIIGRIACVDVELTRGEPLRWKLAFDHSPQ